MLGAFALVLPLLHGDVLPPPTGLRVEHLGINERPLGIEVPAATSAPRLWWMLPTAPRALTQHAYETELAMEGAVIQATTGRVESGQSEAVPLQPVEPATGYGVRVRYWACSASDGTVQPSGWSSWLNFTSGLPSTADWSGAVWLTHGAGVEPPVCAGCTNPSSCCDPAVQLRTVFDVASSHPQTLERAQLFVASRGYYRCWINGLPASDHAQGHTTTFEVRTLYDTFDVLSLLREGSNGLGCSVARGWFGEGGGMGTMMNNAETRPKSLILKLSLRYKNGTRVAVVSSADGRWSATTSGPYLLCNTLYVLGGQPLLINNGP